jgi:hypothetical protein
MKPHEPKNRAKTRVKRKWESVIKKTKSKRRKDNKTLSQKVKRVEKTLIKMQ